MARCHADFSDACIDLGSGSVISWRARWEWDGGGGDADGVMRGITYIGVRESDLNRRYAVMQMCGMPNIIRGV